jgi:hypothetical protein
VTDQRSDRLTPRQLQSPLAVEAAKLETRNVAESVVASDREIGRGHASDGRLFECQPPVTRSLRRVEFPLDVRESEVESVSGLRPHQRHVPLDPRGSERETPADLGVVHDHRPRHDGVPTTPDRPVHGRVHRRERAQSRSVEPEMVGQRESIDHECVESGAPEVERPARVDLHPRQVHSTAANTTEPPFARLDAGADRRLDRRVVGRGIVERTPRSVGRSTTLPLPVVERHPGQRVPLWLRLRSSELLGELTTTHATRLTPQST